MPEDRSAEEGLTAWEAQASEDSSVGLPQVPRFSQEFLPEGPSVQISSVTVDLAKQGADRRTNVESVKSEGVKHLGRAINIGDVDLTADYQTVASFTVNTPHTNYVIWGALTFYHTLNGLATATCRVIETTVAENMNTDDEGVAGDTSASTAGVFFKFTASVSGELTNQTPGQKTFEIQGKSGTSNTRVDATDGWIMGYAYS